MTGLETRFTRRLRGAPGPRLAAWRKAPAASAGTTRRRRRVDSEHPSRSIVELRSHTKGP